MIFRSRRSRAGAAVAEPGERPDLDQLEAEIEALSSANRDSRDAELERRILRLRHRLGAGLLAAAGEPPDYPPPDYERLCEPAELPQVTPADFSAGVLRAGILRDGYLLIRGGVDRGEAERFALEIERAFAARSS